MTIEHLDILIHIGSQIESGGYAVEAELDDGSRFRDGQLMLDMDRLRAAALDAQAYGMELFYALFSGPIRRAYDKATGRAEAETGGRLRVRLWIDEQAAELHALAWERLHHNHRGQEVPLATSTQTPFSRYTPLETAEARPLSQAPLRLLFAASNPHNLPAGLAPVVVETEVDSLRRALEDLLQTGQVELTLMPGHSGVSPEMQARLEQSGAQVLNGPTGLEALLRALPGQHVLHFLGHGAFRRREETGPGTAVLYLEKESGEFQIARDEDLVARLASAHPLPHLIFLAACESARRDPEHAFIGLGPRLVAAGVPAVVAMQDVVPMELARQLAADFYRQMLEHGQVDTALNQARLLLADREATDWAIPVLFMRLANGRLFDFPPDQARAPRLPYEPETVLVPEGPFVMGAEEGPGVQPAEAPGHTVDLPGFRIGKTPVTNAQYAAFIQHEKGQEPPRKTGWFLREPPEGKLDHPVVGVSWLDAQAYCRWLSKQSGRSYRLPTEAEWEKAARGAEGTIYPWGDDWEAARCNQGGADTSPVDDHPQGASPYGCLDMAGNVQEWTATLWGSQRAEADFPYPYQPHDGREDSQAEERQPRTYRVHRGGSFQDDPQALRASARQRALSQSATRDRGFRVVMSLD